MSEEPWVFKKHAVFEEELKGGQRSWTNRESRRDMSGTAGIYAIYVI